MGRRSSGPPTPRALRDRSRAEPATTPPPPQYDPDAPPPSRRATEPPVADYASIRESCSSFEIATDGAVTRNATPAPAPDDSHLVFAAVLTGEDLDWFSLSDASRRVVASLDGRRSMREIAIQLEIAVADASDIARDLLAHGIISLRGVG